jgi:maleamate amidohydrolase
MKDQGTGIRKPVWADIIPQREIEIYRKAGFCKTFGFGERPAVMVVDVEYGFTGLRPDEDILSAIDKFPMSCGKEAWASAYEIRKLIGMARSYRIPILYVHSRRKKEAKPIEGVYGDEIIGPVKPLPEDIVLEKEGYSAFFGTNLVSHLIDLKVDTVIVTGCVTSGCIRASVIDAYAYRFKVIVPVECVFDRAVVPHKVNLFDMDAKYADVMDLDEVFSYFSRLPSQI